MSAKPLVLAVLGPTASGKSALGLALAEHLGGEILNCDSTAVYRGFDIGTDKVPREEQRGIPHHLIDIADPTEVYTAARFTEDAERAIREIHVRGKLPILVGGTGFYYRALTRGLFPGPGSGPGCPQNPGPGFFLIPVSIHNRLNFKSYFFRPNLFLCPFLVKAENKMRKHYIKPEIIKQSFQ